MTPTLSRPQQLPDGICENTMVGADRLWKLADYVAQTALIPGDIAEVGVYRGGTALLFAELRNETKWLHLFDTFAGLPSPTLEDTHKAGDFACSLETVRQLLDPRPKIKYYQGVFPDETGGSLIGLRFSLVHLDCDLYAGVKAGLDMFGSRMNAGGIIVLDDVYCPDCPGALKAVEEYCAATGHEVIGRTETQGAIQY